MRTADLRVAIELVTIAEIQVRAAEPDNALRATAEPWYESGSAPVLVAGLSPVMPCSRGSAASFLACCCGGAANRIAYHGRAEA